MAAPSPGIYVAGHYTATWGGTDIGTTETGFTIHVRQHEVGVKDDGFGEMDVDMIQAGTDVEVELIAIEWRKFLTVMPAQQGAMGHSNDNVGHLLSSLAKTLILTPITGTPADAESSKVFTATKAILIGDYSYNFSYNLRRINARFRCLPDGNNNNETYTF